MTMTHRLAVMAAHGAATAAHQVTRREHGGNGGGKGGGWLSSYLGQTSLDSVLDDLSSFAWLYPDIPAEALLRRLHETTRRPFTRLEDVPCEIRVAATVFLAIVVALGEEAFAADAAETKRLREEAERARQAAAASRPRRRDPAAGTIFARAEEV